jgi:hypothetical protein
MKVATKLDVNRVDHIPSLLNQHCPTGKGVEIGVFKGEFSKQVLSAWNGTLYLIDPWRELDPGSYNDASNHANHADAYEQAMNNIRGFEHRAIMIRALSHEVADLFADESLDYVYIDGNHAYDYVKLDLEKWYPKLKKGGILAGHDYIGMDWYADNIGAPNGKDKYIWHYPIETPDLLTYSGVFGVNPAVDEFAEQHNLSFNVTNEFYGTFYAIK